MQKDLRYYKGLPYTLKVEPETDSKGRVWIADYIELPGCKTDGPTQEEAVANAQELFDEYISTALTSGLDIPEPEVLKVELTREVKMVISGGVPKTASEPGETTKLNPPQFKVSAGTSKSGGTKVSSGQIYEEVAGVPA